MQGGMYDLCMNVKCPENEGFCVGNQLYMRGRCRCTMKIQYMETAALDRRERRGSCVLQEDGQMSKGVLGPVSRMPRGYRVPGLVK